MADGSGMTSDKPCGWACLHHERGRRPFWLYGGTSHGTNNYAELEPFVHALWLFSSQHPGPRKVQVVCVSDSELTVRCGNRQYARNANLALWASIDHYERLGYSMRFVHVPRNSNPVNKRADALGRSVRLELEKLAQEGTLDGGQRGRVCGGVASIEVGE